ncbi:hypothetical protein [Streptomyces gardneri]|uniref:hypothetical protein n=1 Tax=Streptomyces gardneri TaxID=66892 RepID=UPI0035E1395F
MQQHECHEGRQLVRVGRIAIVRAVIDLGGLFRAVVEEDARRGDSGVGVLRLAGPDLGQPVPKAPRSLVVRLNSFAEFGGMAAAATASAVAATSSSYVNTPPVSTALRSLPWLYWNALLVESMASSPSRASHWS